MKFKGYGGGSLTGKLRLICQFLTANVWWIFLLAAVLLFGYVFIRPNYWLMLVLFVQIVGLLFWRC